jgi:hypothetical protein
MVPGAPAEEFVHLAPELADDFSRRTARMSASVSRRQTHRRRRVGYLAITRWRLLRIASLSS